MADQCPNKTDIQAIFKRLRNIPANKVCFDCNSKNPTWASVTFGVFICIDCSAVHRGLGVHLTFVRSTQLDTNWTWVQLRQMQLGGNANASAFFRQHNCTTTDAQQKYNSRAAQLYREKLHQMAIQAMRVHGTKVHLDSTHEHSHGGVDELKEIDFFDELSKPETATGTLIGFDDPIEIPKVPQETMTPVKPGDMIESDISLALSSDTSGNGGATRKSTIGARKPPAKKGLGAKKGGLGAQRVKANFQDIEREAQLADELKERAMEDAKKQVEVKAEETEKQLASMRLAYQDISVQQKKEEDKLKASNPKKAEQLERLGMGIGARKSGGVSHSVSSAIKTLDKEDPDDDLRKFNLARTVPPPRSSALENDFFDDYNNMGGGSYMGYYGYKNSSRSSENKALDWTILDHPKERDVFEHSSNNSSNNTSWTQQDQETKRNTTKYSAENMSISRSTARDAPAADGTEAQKKFGGAKAISSDQFFGDSRDNADWERKSNLSRFEGSTSISSSDYFGDGRSGAGNRGGGVGGGGPSYQTPDLEDVKESVRQGVTKVAGKLSNLANGVMSSIQERYGY